MPAQLTRLPFPGPLNKNLAEYFNQMGASAILNGILEIRGDSAALHTRPGLIENYTLPTVSGIDGLFYWPSKKQYVAVADGFLFASSTASSGFNLVTKPGESLLRGPVQFAATSEYLYIASQQGRMLRWNGSSPAERVMEPDAPGNVCSVTFLNGRLLAAEHDSVRVWYTEPYQVDDPTKILEWSGYFDVIKSTSPIKAILTYGTEILVLKATSAEFWYDDGITPFRPVPGGSFMSGLASPRGFTITGDMVFFMDSDRKIHKLMGRTPENISGFWVDNYIQNMSYVLDLVVTSTDRYVIFTFKTAEKTLVYDTKVGLWYEWSFLQNGRHKAYLGAHAVRTVGGDWMMGGYDNTTYVMNDRKFTDGDNICQLKFLSPHFDHGTEMFKRSSRTIIKVSQMKTNDIFIELEDAVRCHEYEYVLPKSNYYKYSIMSGLPSGFSFDPETATLSADASDRDVGSYVIKIKAINAAGKIQVINATLNVVDFDPSVWVVV